MQFTYSLYIVTFVELLSSFCKGLNAKIFKYEIKHGNTWMANLKKAYFIVAKAFRRLHREYDLHQASNRIVFFKFFLFVRQSRWVKFYNEWNNKNLVWRKERGKLSECLTLNQQCNGHYDWVKNDARNSGNLCRSNNGFSFMLSALCIQFYACLWPIW